MDKGCSATHNGWGTATVFVVAGLFALRLSAGPPPNAAATTSETSETSEKDLDPAAWGHDHVGRPLPEYLTGDECLFCHREVGETWADNEHQLTLRPVRPDEEAMRALAANQSTADIAPAVEFLLGSERQVRYLQRSDEYGKLRLLSTAYQPGNGPGELLHAADPKWDDATFAEKCAGCHTTAVDPTTHAFSAVSLDCYTCHGSVPLAHSKDVSLVHLSAERQESRHVVSICGQCHLRGGKSKSTGLPYPNNFVAGDNLFRDFDVDWDEATIAKMSPGDAHVFQNVRDVALRGMNELTCLSCHEVHDQSTEKHQDLARTSNCSTCHIPGEPTPDLAADQVHSAVCGY